MKYQELFLYAAGIILAIHIVDLLVRFFTKGNQGTGEAVDLIGTLPTFVMFILISIFFSAYIVAEEKRAKRGTN